MEFIRAREIQKITGLSFSSANRIIQKINAELREQGYLTLKGKVPKQIFEERFGGKKWACTKSLYF